MPLYEYRCADCATRFERLTYDRDGVPACPSCGGANARRLLSLIARPVLAGGGAAAAGESCGTDAGGCGGGCDPVN